MRVLFFGVLTEVEAVFYALRRLPFWFTLDLSLLIHRQTLNLSKSFPSSCAHILLVQLRTPSLLFSTHDMSEFQV